MAPRLLKGHRASVNCIDATAPSTLATGSDDASVRIWDLRADKAVKSIVKCFGGPVEAVRFHPHNAHLLYAASGTAVYEFDLRGDGVLVAAPAAVSERLATEDINALAVSPCGERLAAADDSGAVTLVETGRLRAYRPPTLTGAHTNLVNAVAFHPTDRAALVSGGFDCQLCTWDLSRPGAGGGGAPRAVVHAGQLGAAAGAGNPTINPPFVQCVAYVRAQRGHAGPALGVAVALGDGSIKVVDASNPTAVWAVAADAHGGMATALFCRAAAGTGTGSRDTATNPSLVDADADMDADTDSWLFSGGVFWLFGMEARKTQGGPFLLPLAPLLWQGSTSSFGDGGWSTLTPSLAAPRRRQGMGRRRRMRDATGMKRTTRTRRKRKVRAAAQAQRRRRWWRRRRLQVAGQ